MNTSKNSSITGVFLYSDRKRNVSPITQVGSHLAYLHLLALCTWNIPTCLTSFYAEANLQQMQKQQKQTFMTVKVGNSGYFSEFVIGRHAYIKNSFAPSKKHYTVIESAIAHSLQQDAKHVRTRITITELLNPEQ